MVKNSLMKIVGKFLPKATVTGVKRVANSFVVVELESEHFTKTPWSHGDHLQILVTDTNRRIYTPFNVNRESGRLSLLIFDHGRSLGSDWARNLKSGDTVSVHGPQKGHNLKKHTGALIYFGDETAFVAASLLKEISENSRNQMFVFEVSSIVEAKIALQLLNLGEAELIEKKTIREHLPIVADKILSLARSLTTHHIVGAGEAGAIKTLKSSLLQKEKELLIHLQPYWFEGRSL